MPIERATKAARTHIESAKVIVKEVEVECPQAKAQINALSADLDGALNELSTSEGSRVQLETQLKQQTSQANTLANDYDKAGAKIASLQESRHGWVKRFWIVTGLLTLAGLWIFKGPLLAVAGGL